MGFLKDLIRGQLPDYIIDNDSYKDVDAKGFVERYLSIFGDELDEFYYDQIDKIVDQVDPLNVGNVALLDLIAAGLGDLPNISKDSDHYRRILSFILSIWKVKGREKSYVAILYTLGLTNTVITQIDATVINYDDGVSAYDDGVSFYDTNCPTCSSYNLSVTGPTLTAAIYQKLINLITLVEPINAHIKVITYNGTPITLLTITVDIVDGDLVYDNVYDPDLILTLDSFGDLQISGPNASLYFIDGNGDLIFIH